MRDINNSGEINVQGDMHIVDNSHSEEHKLLIHCSTEELLQERPFRLENIKIEQKKKVKKLKPFYVLAVLFGIAAAVYSAIHGKTDFMTLILGIISIFIGYNTLKFTVEPNAFQIEERNAVDEISKILKQRRVE
ncbi:hypothetical protein [uncultured Pseudoalteromonas sp.]|jgi:ABC-type uncharacterized transport system permease subunit|uniref:hypothetical protein n=1 Tax=uncultured Pseudoalteromonas sp. TaxID=114053 RepID=UPI000C3F0CB6|nr:hypothetical protein [uncultured Pseudoalteromonas sp.]MBD55349.1 hypothetical protein [Pseudoalteromonas sp.]|tara:strand:- start:191 stop:592 length:402 start_codon:yes stop_codon:yes gene_type:complete